MSKWVEFQDRKGGKILVDAEKIDYAVDEGENGVDLYVSNHWVTLGDSYRTVKGRLIKSNGEDS